MLFIKRPLYIMYRLLTIRNDNFWLEKKYLLKLFFNIYFSVFFFLY